MSDKKILIINGHPDEESFNFGLSDAYKNGAEKSDAEVKEIRIRELSFNPNLQFGYRKRTELEPDLIEAQEKLKWADHIVWIYPVWWGSVPAIMKGFLDRWYYRLINKSPSHYAMRKLTMNFIGVKSVKITSIGPLRLSKEEFRKKWIKKVEKLGEQNK